jgi:hypothetical protein
LVRSFNFWSVSGIPYDFCVALACPFVPKINGCVWLEHPWIKEGGADKPLDSAVLSRMKQFRAMNKLKKLALKVNF